MNNMTGAQFAAITTLDSGLVVSAGAGAGKTRVLTARYIHILQERQGDVGEIAAITFTRKAAREMKERIRASVDDLVESAESAEERLRWKRVSRQLETAAISTVHGLCSRILKENPVEAELDPDVRILEDDQEKIMRMDKWNKTLEQASSQRQNWLERLMTVYGREQIKSAFLPLWDKLESEGRLGSNLQQDLLRHYPDPEPAISGAKIAVLAAAAELLATLQLIKPTTKAAEAIRRFAEVQDDFRRSVSEAGGDDGAALRWVKENASFSANAKESKAAASDLKEALSRLETAILDKKAIALIPDICNLLLLFHDEMEQAKLKAGVLTYSDLEKKTVVLLQSYPAICRRYQRRFRFLMVDECQDINDMQRRIIYLLAGGEAESLNSGHLFIVGDIKQSIYRFRGADVQVFERMEKDILARGGKIIELKENFRSTRRLVSAYNTMFSDLMSVQTCEGAGPEADDILPFAALTGVRESPEATAMELLVIDKAGVSKDIPPRRVEAAIVAQQILALVSERSVQIGERFASYGDIAVLLRSFSDVALYQEAFQKVGIPFHVSSGRGFLQCREVLDMICLLRFVNNPRDNYSLAALLRSPLFLVPDEAILRLSLPDGSLWEALHQAGGPEEENAYRCLSELLAARDFLSVAEFLRKAIELTHFDLICLGQFLGTQKYANVLKFVEMADSFRMERVNGLPEFLRRLEQLAGIDSQDGEAEIATEAGNTVRIMTIHKAKGLEFPVVVIPDLHRPFFAANELVRYEPATGVGLKMPDDCGRMMATSHYEKARRTAMGQERKELKRLLYVAMTRASDYLILSGVMDIKKTQEAFRQKDWLSWISGLYQLPVEWEDWPSDFLVGEAKLRITRVSDFSGCILDSTILSTPPATDASLDTIVSQTATLAKPLDCSPEVLSVTSLAHFAECPRRYYYKRYSDWPILPKPIAADENPSGAVAAEVGSAMHKFCELYNASLDINKTLWQAVEGVVPQRRREVTWQASLFMAEQYAKSDFFTQKAGLPDRREWDFFYRLIQPNESVAPVWVQGRIDQLIFYPDGTIGIIDYKTDQVDANNLEALKRKYRVQVGIYALAAETILRQPVREALLYFTRINQLISMEFGPQELEKILEEVRRIASHIRTKQTEEDYPWVTNNCRFCDYNYICRQKLIG